MKGVSGIHPLDPLQAFYAADGLRQALPMRIVLERIAEFRRVESAMPKIEDIYPEDNFRRGKKWRTFLSGFDLLIINTWMKCTNAGKRAGKAELDCAAEELDRTAHRIGFESFDSMREFCLLFGWESLAAEDWSEDYVVRTRFVDIPFDKVVLADVKRYIAILIREFPAQTITMLQVAAAAHSLDIPMALLGCPFQEYVDDELRSWVVRVQNGHAKVTRCAC